MPDVRKKGRQDRLGAALRENLKRRKQQAKGRAGQGAADDEAAPTGPEAPETAADERNLR